jgi:hypothetical protein
MSDHVHQGEKRNIDTAKGGPIGIPCLLGREGETIIAMVAPRVWLPARKLVEATISSSESGERERSPRVSKN